MFRIFFYSLTCILISTSSIAAPRTGKNPSDIQKHVIQEQRAVVELSSEGLSYLISYLAQKDPLILFEAHEDFTAATTKIEKLLKCCAKNADADLLKEVQSILPAFNELDQHRMDELAAKEPKRRFNVLGKSVVLSEDGEAPLLVVEALFKSQIQTLAKATDERESAIFVAPIKNTKMRKQNSSASTDPSLAQEFDSFEEPAIPRLEFDGALIEEQGVTFGIVIVKLNVMRDHAMRDRVLEGAQLIFFGVPVIIMAQNASGSATYYGRKDIVDFLAEIPVEAIPWKHYSNAE